MLPRTLTDTGRRAMCGGVTEGVCIHSGGLATGCVGSADKSYLGHPLPIELMEGGICAGCKIR